MLLRIAGFPLRTERLARFAARIETTPLTDFVNLQLALANVDLNIAPLQDNVFTNCKSELKYFEAAAAGTVTIASPTYAFRNSIVDGVNGFFASPIDWYDLLAQRVDRMDETGEIAATAVSDVLARYSPAAQGDALEAALLS